MEQRLDPSIRIVWLASGLLLALIPVVATMILALIGLPAWILGVAGAIAAAGVVLAVAYPLAKYRRWSYALREHDLVVRHGVLVHVERWIPRTRVQYVDLTEGPVERVLGLHTLVVYTAGAGLLAISVPGLPASEAEHLREELLSWRVQDPEAR